MYVHPEALLVAAKVGFVDGIDAQRLEHVSNEVDQALRRALPEVTEVFLDPTPARSG